MQHRRARRELSRPISNTGSGQGGPCLTDAAHEAALDEPLVARRYAVIRTGIPAMIAALNAGGVMKSSRLRLVSRRLVTRSTYVTLVGLRKCQAVPPLNTGSDRVVCLLSSWDVQI